MNNFTKINICECIRTLINIVAILIVGWAILSAPTSTSSWETVVGASILWFLGDFGLSVYLEVLFQREES
jgi:hypothetical protein